MNLLVCHGDEAALESLEIMLGAQRCNVYGTDTGEEAIDLGRLYSYDAIVLGDTVDMGADVVIKTLRDYRIKTPILVLSEHANHATIVRALGLGADDYVLAPWNDGELIARLNAVVRRSNGHARSLIQISDNVVIDVNEKRVEVGGARLKVTNKEYAIFELLALRRGHVQTKETILNHLYGGFDEPEIKIIDVFLCKLRKKLVAAGEDPFLIQTVWGRGYVIAKLGAEGVIHQNEMITDGRARYGRELTPINLSEREIGELVA